MMKTVFLKTDLPIGRSHPSNTPIINFSAASTQFHIGATEDAPFLLSSRRSASNFLESETMSRRGCISNAKTFTISLSLSLSLSLALAGVASQLPKCSPRSVESGNRSAKLPFSRSPTKTFLTFHRLETHTYPQIGRAHV